MANGLFSGFNPFVPRQDQAGAEQYLAETRLGELPALGETIGETAGFQPTTFNEGGTVVIDPTNPTTQARPTQMQAGLTGDDAVLPLVGTGIVSAGAAKLADEALRKQQTKLFNELYRGSGGRFTKGAKPVTRLDVLKNLGSRLGALRGASGMAGMVNPYTATAAGLLALEEAPKAFGSDKSTSEILTELAATTPEERAGAAEYASLGTDVLGLGELEETQKQAVEQPAVPMMGLETDPQGRMIPPGFETREEAFPEYEREAAAREERLRQRQALRERFPYGIPVSSRLESEVTGEPTDAERRRFAKGLVSGASVRDIADSIEIANKYGLDPRTGEKTAKEPTAPTELEKARTALIQKQIEALGEEGEDEIKKYQDEAARLGLTGKDAQSYVLGRLNLDPSVIVGFGIGGEQPQAEDQGTGGFKIVE